MDASIRQGIVILTRILANMVDVINARTAKRIDGLYDSGHAIDGRISVNFSLL